MKVLVTGSDGFIGKRVVKVLEDRRIALFAGTRQSFDMAELGGTVETLKDNRITHIIHLAARADSDDKKDLFESNIEATQRLIQAARVSEVKHITFASTNNVYDINDSGVLSEKDARIPADDNPYGLSKAINEMMLEELRKESSITVAIMRLSDVYGPHQRYGNLIKAVVSSAVNGKSLKLYGEGIRKRDYIYVDDAAEGLVFACEKELNDTYNLSTGVGTSVKEMVVLAKELSGDKCSIERISINNEDKSSVVLSPEKLKKAGYIAKTSFKDGLNLCIQGAERIA